MGVMHACNHPGCNKQFDRKYNLKCHLRIHSDEKPYQCHHQHCTRSFRWKSSLNHHLMSLDHTPMAARRQKKAQAAKRRKEQIAAAALRRHQATATAVALESDDAQMLTSHRTVLKPVPLQSTEALQNVDFSDVSGVSLESPRTGTSPHDTSSLKMPLPLKVDQHMPSDPTLYSESMIFQQPRVQLQPPLITTRTHQTPYQMSSKPYFSPRPSRQLALSAHYAEHESMRGMSSFSEVRERCPLGYTMEPSRPKDVTYLDTTLEQADDCASLLSAVKRGTVDCTNSIFKTENLAEVLTPSWTPDFLREVQYFRPAPAVQVPKQALVWVSEDSSPAFALNSVPSTLDPLFSSCNLDVAGLRTF